MRTNVPHIYAIGDVTAKLQLAHVAEAQGVVAAETIGKAETMALGDYRMMPRATFCQPQVASFGLTEQQARDEGYDVKVAKFPFSANGKANGLGEPIGFVKLIADGEHLELLGGHLIGPDVSELLPELTLAQKWDLTAPELARNVHTHPTLSRGCAGGLPRPRRPHDQPLTKASAGARALTARGCRAGPRVRRGAARAHRGDLLRGARRHDPAALLARAGPEVDDPVRRSDHAHVVLDDHDGVAGVDQPVQLGHQHLHVGRVQAGRRLVQDVERVTAPGPLQLGGQLDPLRLAARQLGGRLTQVQVAQPDVAAASAGCARPPGRRRRTRSPRPPPGPARPRWCCRGR